MMPSTSAFVALASTALLGATSSIPAGTMTYTVALTGAAESNFAHSTGGTGDLDATGSVRLALDPANKQVCYDFELSGASTPLMAHIHEGPPLKNGPPVITLFTGPGADLDGCVTWLHHQVAEIVANPADFYVSVETTEYPDGAVRGQIG